MEQGKQDDKSHWGETGSLRIRGRLYRTTEDAGTIVVDPHQVVYPQEPLWVLDLRFVESDGNNPKFVRIVLRPEDGSDWWSGDVRCIYS